VKKILVLTSPVNYFHDDYEKRLFDILLDSISIRLLHKDELDMLSPNELVSMIHNCQRENSHIQMNNYTKANVALIENHYDRETKKRAAALKDIKRLKKAVNKNDGKTLKSFNKKEIDGYPLDGEAFKALKKCLNMMHLNEMDINSNGENYNILTGEYEYIIQFEDAHLYIKVHHDGCFDYDGGGCESAIIWDFSYDEKGIELVDFMWAG
jgi:regulator of sigma D